MRVVRHQNAVDFLEYAQSWLSTAEAENNVPLGVARRLADDDNGDAEVYWATIQEDGQVVGCAFCTPPYSVSITRMPVEAIDPLVDDLFDFDSELPGVGGPAEEAHRFAETWSVRTGTVSRVRTRLLIHELTQVQFPDNPPNGGLRNAGVIHE